MDAGFEVTEIGKFLRETVGTPVTKAFVWFCMIVGAGVLLSVFLDSIARIAEKVGGDGDLVIAAAISSGVIFLIAFLLIAAYTVVLFLMRHFYLTRNEDVLSRLDALAEDMKVVKDGLGIPSKEKGNG